MQDWERSLDLNIGYMFLTVRHVLPVMQRQKSGVIVNISSIASIRWLGTAYIGYSAAKAAINQFTQAIALQYAAQGSGTAKTLCAACTSKLTVCRELPMMYSGLVTAVRSMR